VENSKAFFQHFLSSVLSLSRPRCDLKGVYTPQLIPFFDLSEVSDCLMISRSGPKKVDVGKVVYIPFFE